MNYIITQEEMNRLLSLTSGNFEAFEFVTELKDREPDDIPPPEGHIHCPHCNGSGLVKEDFLTEEHVDEVFSEYVSIFGRHGGCGVDSFTDWGTEVHLALSWTRRGCTDYESASLPKSYFTRNKAKRIELMTAAADAEKAAKEAADKKSKLARLLSIQAEAERLERELEQ